MEDAQERLIKRFAFSELQAKAILDMRLSRLVALEIQKLEEEYQSLKKLIAELKDLLAHPEKIYKMIQDELTEIAKVHGNDRRTEIVAEAVTVLEAEDYIQKANVVITLTKSGYMKRTPANTYRQQGRGGVGVKGVTTSGDEDLVSMLFTATTHDLILFITNKGRSFYIKSHEIPESSRTAKGTHIKMILAFGAGEEIASAFVFNNFEEAKDIFMVTRAGVGKKCAIADFINAKKRGIQAINLRDNDTLVGALEVREGNEIMITSRQGLAVRTNENEFREMGRAAGGVRAMTLESGDEVVGLDVVNADRELLVVSEKGYGKKIAFEEFTTAHRGGKGVIYMKTSDKTGEIAAIRSVSKGEGILLITSSGNIIRVNSDDISLLGRPAMGVRLVNVQEPDIVVDAAVIRAIGDAKDDGKEEPKEDKGK